MRKRDELSAPNSCLNKAEDNDWVFVLKEGDPSMARTIRFWIGDRLRIGVNRPGDEKLAEAERLARLLEV